MDSFIDSVNSQVTYLNGNETSLSIYSIATGYWYKNNAPGSSDEFMPSNLLKDAFYRALQDFPIFAGHLKTDNYSRMYVDVDKENLNMPVYIDTTCNLSYSDVEKTGFNITKLPVDLYGTYGVPVPTKLSGGKIKPANFYILRFKNNSGVLVYASIGHCITDGYGYVNFMNRWAEVARWMKQPQDDNNKVPLPIREYIHDRSLSNGLRSNRSSALSLSEFKLQLNNSNFVSRWLARMSPEKRGWLLKKWEEEKSYTYSFFHIHSKTIENLRNSVQEYAPENVKYSINDIITTYLSIVVAQAKQKAKADKESRSLIMRIRKAIGHKVKAPEEFTVGVNMNMRSQVNHPDAKNYMGNMVLIENTDFPYELIQKGPTEDVLSTLAPKIRRIASESHVEYYAQEGYLLDNRPDKYLYDMFFDPEYDDCLELSNHSRFAHYEIDFGSGIPELVRNAPDACNILAYIMPANPKVGGYNIELKLASDVAAHVIQNTSWMKLVDTYEVNKQL